MTGSALQSAIREWHATLRRPVSWALLAGLSAIITIMGPFGTGDVMNIPTAFIYWLCIVAASYSIGHLMDSAVREQMHTVFGAGIGPFVQGILTGLCVSCVVFAANYLALDYLPRGNEALTLIGTVVSIAIIITYLIEAATAQRAIAATPVTEIAPPLLERLPLEKRGQILALSVEDHYVRVYTSKGEALILMRLADAIREVQMQPGDQVHRSHWAAWDAVTSVRRDGARAILTLSNDVDIPVSRANVPKLKEAGLLPR